MGRRVTNGFTGNIGASLASLSVVENNLKSVETNQNIVLDPNGTGKIYTQKLLHVDNSTAATSATAAAFVSSGGIAGDSLYIANGIQNDQGFSTSTTHMTIPSGTTAQRPGSPGAGFVRFNTSYGLLEVYNGTAWIVQGFRDVDVSGSRTTAAFETNWCNTASGAFTVTLPASPAKGERIRFFDVANTFDSNALTVGRNGQRIQGDAANMTVGTEGAAFELVYYNSTYGWRIFTI